MPKVRVGDIDMYYEVQGEGQPLLLIHGLTLDHLSWSFQFHAFSEKYKVVAFDNRGVGRTDAPDKPYTTEMMADDVAGLLDVLEIQKAHVLGLSLGGMIAQEFALKYPQRVDRLVLAATAARPAKNAQRSSHIIDTLLRMVKAGVGLEERTRMFMVWSFTPKFFEDPKQAQIMVNLVTSSPHPQTSEGLAGQISAAEQHDSYERLGDIKSPTLVLAARDDLLLPARLSEELAEGINGSKLVVIEGAAHLFCIQHPGEFNQAVLDFLGNSGTA
jgi:pimeloyl-ACP methyl ester carboxylesterase